MIHNNISSEKALDEYAARLARKLEASEIKANLFRASLFLTAFEMLKYSLINRLEMFVAEPRFATEVLALHKKRFAASCLWYLNQGILTDQQVNDLHAIRQHRDQIAHDLPNLLLDPEVRIDVELLEKARACMEVLGRFWISIAVDSDPQFDGRDIDLDQVKHGPVELMDYILAIVNEGL